MRTKILFSITFALLCLLLPNLARANPPDYYVTVKIGDTLYSIAARYGVSTDALVAANKLPNANFVYAGQRLVIPRKNLPNASTTATNGVYLVRAGDTLYSIAVKHSITVAEMMQLNSLASSFVYVGQTLRVPNAAKVNNATLLPIAPSMNNAPARSQKFLYNDPNGAPAPLGGIVTNPPTSDEWIEINVTTQTVTAYEGSTPIKSVVVSTGVARTPTVLGTFKIHRKIPSQTMSGGSQAAGD